MKKPGRRPPLTHEQILAWADAHHERTGRWPSAGSGAIVESPGDKWDSINSAMAQGHRGLPGGSSLAELLKTHRGHSARREKPPLSLEQILTWAEDHALRTGKWPSADSGPVLEAPEETWRAINTALGEGLRGLPGGDSLRKLRQRHQGTEGEDVTV